MFGFRKPEPAPEGPVGFEVAVEIERAASEVYPLIDWTDDRNAKCQLGHSVESMDGGSDRFRLIMTEMPDLRFDLSVSNAVPDRAYAFSCHITPRVGRLESSEEQYSFEPLGEGRCKVTITTIATFQSGLNRIQFEQELLLMSIASHRAAAKLKIHAEQGPDAVRAFERELDL